MPNKGDWSGSTRRSRLPPDWSQIRRRILDRDNHQCQWRNEDGTLCLEPATDVDHKVAKLDDHRDEALQSLCTRHHRFKSAKEGAAAAAATWRRRRQAAQRPQEPHPGLIQTPDPMRKVVFPWEEPRGLRQDPGV